MHKKSLLYFFIIISVSIKTYGKAPVFEFQNSQNLLSNNAITAIIEDKYGFLWLGTEFGLARFDGYTFKSFFADENNPLSIPNNNIKRMIKDRNDKIWIACNKGIAYIDPESGKIMQPEFCAPLAYFSINTLKEDKEGNIWAGTNKGVYVFNDSIGKLHKIKLSIEGISDFNVNFIDLDKNNNVWIGSSLGFCTLFSPTTKQIFAKNSALKCRTQPYHSVLGFFSIDSKNRLWINDSRNTYILDIENSNYINTRKCITQNTDGKSILFLKNGDIYIGTRWNGGIYIPGAQDIQDYSPSSFWIGSPSSMDMSNTVNVFFEDHWGNVWAGTKDGLFIRKNTPVVAFHTIRGSEENPNTPSHNALSSIIETSDGSILIGTNSGINKFEWLNTEKTDYRFTRLNHTLVSPGNTHNNVQSLIEDRKHQIWIGTKQGISYYDPESGKFFEKAETNRFLRSNNLSLIKTFYEDNFYDVWIGFSSGGVAVYQQDKDQFRLYRELKNEDVRAILKDTEGYMWIGTRNGLFKMKATTHIPKEDAIPQAYKHITNDPNSLPGNWITSLYLDSSQTLWIGTSSGLCIYDPENDNFIKQELPSGNRAPYISGIIEDNYKTVWVITTGGIYQLTKKKNIQYFELANGNFTSINYAYGACKDKDGMVYLGGVSGLTYFNPLEIIPDSTINPVYISDLKLAGDMTIETNENINRMKKITLNHHYSQFSFEFSSLYYANPYRIKYSYMLEGIDKEWIYSDARNYVTYTNIPPGKYIFKLRSTNPTGFWQDNTKDIEINILPPPWKTWWAYTLYILAVITLSWVTFRFFMERERLLRSEEMNQWKLKFYTNITHGFKAPLSLMESPLQTLLRNRERMNSSEIQDMLEIMQRNMKRLSHLINQLLEFRKIDRGKSSLELVETDIITLLSDVYESFYSLSRSKGITFNFKTDINSLRVTFDFEKVETILFNLLSNAFKFTNKGGEITLSCNLDPDGSRIWISVSDTGVGIDSRHQQKIFERFWQVDSNHSALLKGTGIGLSLANDFVELHKGKISVESELGKGSTFRFFLWMGNKHFSDQTIYKIKNNEKRHADYINNFIEIEENLTEHESDTPEKEDNRPLIFVIDDDKEHLDYISRMLKHDYLIEAFADCDNVFDEITRKNPTLIISDVMIGNEEQGFKLCKRIKSDIATSHIPVILLTGLASEKDKLSGYEMGADAYVEKPFNAEYLQVRIKQLLNAREKFKEKIKMDIIINPKDISATSTDEKFLTNVMAVIEENIEDENFSLDDFARKMNISRSILNNKLQSLTNQTPIEFVRNIRLKRAARLLTLNAYTVSEISFKVGISAPRYFSTIFKKQFGMTPKEYARKYGKEKPELDNLYDIE